MLEADHLPCMQDMLVASAGTTDKGIKRKLKSMSGPYAEAS